MPEFTYLDVVTLQTLKSAYQELLDKAYPDGVPDEDDPISIHEMLVDIDHLIRKLQRLTPVTPELVFEEPKGSQETPF